MLALTFTRMSLVSASEGMLKLDDLCEEVARKELCELV